MNLIRGWCHEKGVGRDKNQDFMLFNISRIFKCDVCIAVVCDGVGSFKNSEFASGTVGGIIGEWFTRNMDEYNKNTGKKPSVRAIYENLKNTLREELWLAHKIVTDETAARGIEAASTVCAMLAVNNLYCVYSSGDSRAYEIGKRIRQLTKDQVVNIDGRSMLSNCIGCFPGPNVMKLEGKIKKNAAYILATDGFYKKFYTAAEAFRDLEKAKTDADMQNIMAGIARYVRDAGEHDDLTGIALKFI